MTNFKLDNMTTQAPHEYIESDGKEHINGGMIEYSKEDLKLHNDAFHAHTEEEVDPGDAQINDWHTRHTDKHLEVYCDNHPDALECRVYDD